MRSKSEITAEQLIRSAAAIIRRDGLHACTHRAVAEEAQMSLGATTYHFKTLDDLLAAVMHQAIEDFAVSTRHWLSLRGTDDPAAILTDFVFWTIGERSRLTREYELFVAAVSRPFLRAHAAEWLHAHETILSEHFGFSRPVSQAAVSFTDAWLMRGILSGVDDLPDAYVIQAAFHAIVTNRSAIGP
ncbi:TetR/AcrR family transcriptional regulator [Dickeya dadantii]|uniref:TetR/AcrR family transcriptional regulator n=1 Tax=Dickeya dadantii TaxID=204038 RepID=UPI001495F900|nr:TetR family transcriptional regulator [Dickeya dadantii]NPE49974.1 TetR family transcriptional regulator [Dickeya dadantii]